MAKKESKQKGYWKIIAIFAVIIAIISIVVNVWQHFTDYCCNEVSELKLQLSEIKDDDDLVSGVSQELDAKKVECDELMMKLSKAREKGDYDSAAEILKELDNLITDLIQIDTTLEKRFRENRHIKNLNNLKKMCEIVRLLVKDYTDQAKFHLAQLNQMNSELEQKNQRISSLETELKNIKDDYDAVVTHMSLVEEELEKYRKENDQLRYDNSTLSNQLAISQSRSDSLETENDRLNGKIVNVENRFSPEFEINFKKFKTKEGKSFPIPIIINENYMLKESNKRKNYTIYIAIARIDDPRYGESGKYIDTSRMVEYGVNKKWVYHGVCYLSDWDGEKQEIVINVTTTSPKKIKLSQEVFTYDYLIFENGVFVSGRKKCTQKDPAGIALD